MRVAVIGAGPSGLATLKYLKAVKDFFPDEKPVEARLFESEDQIGGTFRYRVYEDAELVSSRQLTTFSDYRFAPDHADFLSAEEYCLYLEGYVKQFDLASSIHLSTTVTKIERSIRGGHIIHYTKDGQSSKWACDAVAICSGLHVTPNMPVLPGVEHVPEVLHSSNFKTKSQLGQDKDIMILGSGETGMDIAYMAVTNGAKSVTLCHRDGFHVAPKRAPDPIMFSGIFDGFGEHLLPASSSKSSSLNVPYDVGAASLFESTYIHPLLRDSFLPWAYYDRFAKWSVALVSGTKAGLDQWVGEIPAERYHASKIFFNKSTKAMPYISEQYRTNSLLNRIRAAIIQIPAVETNDRKIDLAPWPESVSGAGIVTFRENGRVEAEVMRNKVCKPDLMIMASGYTQSFPFLDSDYPLPQWANIRSIWKDTEPTVGFIGFVRPSFGAIPPLSEMQAQLWVLNLLKRLPKRLEEEDHYRLQPSQKSRIQYGVDHEAYVYQLALDMGSAPTFSEVTQFGLKTTVTWALSANVNTKFRLIGPWKWSGAKKVMDTEIWETISRRRMFFGHFTLEILPIFLFGFLSLVIYLLCAILDTARGAWRHVKQSVKGK